MKHTALLKLEITGITWSHPSKRGDPRWQIDRVWVILTATTCTANVSGTRPILGKWERRKTFYNQDVREMPTEVSDLVKQFSKRMATWKSHDPDLQPPAGGFNTLRGTGDAVMDGPGAPGGG